MNSGDCLQNRRLISREAAGDSIGRPCAEGPAADLRSRVCPLRFHSI